MVVISMGQERRGACSVWGGELEGSIWAVTYFFLEAACSTDQKLLLPNNASNTDRHQNQHHRYHHLAKDLLGPVYLTLSLWNFSGSILIKEIMV